jgi:hypothetical protein
MVEHLPIMLKVNTTSIMAIPRAKENIGRDRDTCSRH